MPAQPAAGVIEALRNEDAEIMGEAWHPSGRLLDDVDWGVESRTHLSRGLGIACRARAEMGRVSRRSRLDHCASGERKGRAHSRQRVERHPAADLVLERPLGRL